MSLRRHNKLCAQAVIIQPFSRLIWRCHKVLLMPWDYTMALMLLYSVMSIVEIPRATMAVYNQATMLMFVAEAAAALASLHHCSLLSPYVAAPAAFLVGATM